MGRIPEIQVSGHGKQRVGRLKRGVEGGEQRSEGRDQRPVTVEIGLGRAGFGGQLSVSVEISAWKSSEETRRLRHQFWTWRVRESGNGALLAGRGVC
jgi:hypothetical protein